MTDLEHLQTQAAALTPTQRAALAAIDGRNFHPCDHPAITLVALTDKGLIHQPARNARWQLTPHARQVLNAPLPHETRLLGNKTGYTTMPWLAIKATGHTDQGREIEPEAIDVDQLNPRWANDAEDRRAAARTSRQHAHELAQHLPRRLTPIGPLNHHS